MTYREMTDKIESFDKMINFMYDIQKEKLNSDDKENAILCGVIVNALCGYRNYLKYEKQYEVVNNK